MKQVKLNSGQSLVESLAALAISIVIISALIVAINQSLKTARMNKVRSYAGKLTQEGIESIRRYKDANSVAAMYAARPSETTDAYCILTVTYDINNAIDPLTPKGANCNFMVNIGFSQTFGRSVTLDYNPAPVSRVDVTVKTTWSEGPNPSDTKTSILKTTLADYE